MKRQLFALLGAVLALPAVAGGTAQKAAPAPPPYSGDYQPVGVDEIGLWREMDEDERALANSPMVIRDEALNKYIRGLLCATVGDDRCKSVRLYIVRTPVMNASMTPNGTMRVFSGLLLRTRSEAELASVLGHEFGHFELRHSLAAFRATRSSTDLLAWAAVLSAMSNSPAAGSNFDNMQLSVYGRLYRFQRDQERAADLRGLGYLNQSAMRPQAASVFWTDIIGEAQASAVERGLSKPKLDRIAFFSTHPPEAERAATLAELALPDGASRDDGAQSYAAAMASWTPQFLDDQIKTNDFGGSDYVINELAERGWTAPLFFARGELYRGRGNPRDLTRAVEYYAQAVGLDPTLAEAHRGLGLSLIKTGRRSEGAVQLRRYLELKPDASDAKMLNMLATTIGEVK
jgi:beta-barrel assembly-enhancing protease